MANSKVTQELEITAARLALGLVQSWDVPSVADRMLCAGVYTPALAELSLLPQPIMSDVAPLFERAMAELGLLRPSPVAAGWMLARQCVMRIAAGEEEPEEVLRELQCLEWELSAFLPRGRYVGESLDIGVLIGIRWDYEEFHGGYYGWDGPQSDAEFRELRAKLDGAARREAREWLARHPLEHFLRLRSE